jgi:hypothetical protein
MTRRTYARGHWSKIGKLEREHMASATDAPEDLGLIDVGDLPTDAPEPPAPKPPRGVKPKPEPDEQLEPDPEPAHLRVVPGERKSRERTAPRVTPKLRADIGAKIGIMLEIPGRVWQARDPICGGTFLQQRPDISDALTAIVCQSPDLIEWFTGVGGGFMLWLNLIMAVQPVAVMAWAHHIAHTVALPPDGQLPQQQPDYSQYAA